MAVSAIESKPYEMEMTSPYAIMRRAPSAKSSMAFLRCIPISLMLLISAMSLTEAQEQKPADPIKEVATKLQSLTRIPLTECKWHSDVAHPEDVSLDDS